MTGRISKAIRMYRLGSDIYHIAAAIGERPKLVMARLRGYGFPIADIEDTVRDINYVGALMKEENAITILKRRINKRYYDIYKLYLLEDRSLGLFEDITNARYKEMCHDIDMTRIEEAFRRGDPLDFVCQKFGTKAKDYLKLLKLI